MQRLKPKLFSVWKTYTKDQLVKDITAGLILAIIALPLSIALAIASGVKPEQGLYTAIIAGFFISFLGGSRVQIGGPTAAFVIIIYGIVTKHGMIGLTIATIMAGFMLIILGFLRLGSLIKYIPYTITTGFTAGIAIAIFTGQLKDFFGLSITTLPAEFTEKIVAYLIYFPTLNWHALVIGVLALLIILFWPKINDRIPGSLVALIVTTLLVRFTPLHVNTIGSVFGTLSSNLPTLSIPMVPLKTIQDLIQPAFTIAILASIESLLSCVVADGMIGSRHRSNMELVAQGVANILSGLFGGIPATGAIARTAANVKNGGRTPIAGMVHAITLLFILLLFMPLAGLIPMPALAAILMVVAYQMSEWRECLNLLRHAPKSDILVLVTTFFLTVFFDLVVAIEFGMVLVALLFMKRMAEVTNVHGWTYIEEDDGEDTEDSDPEHINLKAVPPNTLVYEINGPMFFAATDKFVEIATSYKKKPISIILRMRTVPAMDATAIHTLEGIYQSCKKQNITLIFAHVEEQPLSVMGKAGFLQLIGPENICKSTDEALAHAADLNAAAHPQARSNSGIVK